MVNQKEKENPFLPERKKSFTGRNRNHSVQCQQLLSWPESDFVPEALMMLRTALKQLDFNPTQNVYCEHFVKAYRALST